MPPSQGLILEIYKQEESLRMGLFSQSQSAPTLRHYSQVGVSFTELKQLSLEMVEVLNRLTKDAESKRVQLKSLQKIGQLFWDHLLSRAIKLKLKNTPACALTLSLDDELISIPWELIFDGENFLGLKFNLGRLIRSKGEAAAVTYRDLKDSLKMLILANPSGDLKSAYLEGLNIKNQFSHKNKRVQVDFKSTYIDRQYVKKNICDYDLVHFAGHCEFNARDSKDSGWVLGDGLFKINDILKMGQSASLPALVFSNACHSAQENPDLVNVDYQRANYGIASAFLFAGVRHYIGALRRIEDKASFIFAQEFYHKLLCGSSVGESLRIAKLKLIKEYGESSLHWVNYLLYGDPEFIFFKFPSHHKTQPKLSLIYKKLILKARLPIIFIALGVVLTVALPKINPNKMYLFIQASGQYRQGNNLQAITLAQQLLIKDPDYLAAYPIIAEAYQSIGDKEQALKYYLDYLLKSEKLKNKIQLTQAYIKLGWFYQLDGQFQKAQPLYLKAIELSRQMKNKQNEALALRKLAVWNIDKKDYAQALDLLTKSATINQEFPHNFENIKNLASDYFDIGLVFANKDDYPAAKEFYEKSLKIFKRLKLKNELSDCYYNLGEIYLYQKEYQKALEYYFLGLKVDREQKNKINLASGLNMIGELYLEIDDAAKAKDYFLQALTVSTEINSRQDLASANYNLGLLYQRQGRKNLAREYWRHAQEIYRQTDLVRYQEIKKQLQELDTY